MSDDRAFLNGHAETEPLPADLAAVEQRLTRDGLAWQQEMPATTRLAAYVNTRAPRDVAARSPMHSHKGQHVMDTLTEVRPRDKHPSRYRHSFPIAAAILLLLVVGGYFGLQAFHQQSNAGAPTSTTSTTSPSHTTPPATTVRWYALTNVVLSKPITTPIENFALGNDFTTPEHLSLQSTVDLSQIHPGDVLKLTWEINGTSVTGPDCCLLQLSVQRNGTNFTVPIAMAGTGIVKLYYNTTLVESATFTLVAQTTLPPTALPTPTPASGGLPPPHCRLSFQSDGPTPTPSPCKQA